MDSFTIILVKINYKGHAIKISKEVKSSNEFNVNRIEIKLSKSEKIFYRNISQFLFFWKKKQFSICNFYEN